MGAATGGAAPQPLAGTLERIDSLLRAVIARGRFDLKFEIRPAPASLAEYESTEYVVDFSGPDSDLLLAGGAALLAALEVVILRGARVGEESFGRVAFNCQQWRETRVEELKLMAQVAADRVKETGDTFRMSPMNARERRIVHLALKERKEVRTQSEGMGPERRVVILPA